MENVCELLKFVQKTNPEMTLEKLMIELSNMPRYEVVVINFYSKNFGNL